MINMNDDISSYISNLYLNIERIGHLMDGVKYVNLKRKE